jgi:hypothetical protein
MTLGMREAAALYETAAALTVERVCVEDADLRRFSLGLQRLAGQLDTDADDPYWKPVLARLRRAARELATVPLPPGHASLGLRESAQFIAARLRNCESVFPAHAAAAVYLADSLAEISEQESADPLGAAARLLCEGPGSTVVILRDARHAGALEGRLAGLSGVTVRAAAELDASSQIYGRGVAIGPSSWFPRQVFAAPKAQEIHVVQFDWLRDPPMDVGLLPSSDAAEQESWRGLQGYDGSRSGGESMAPEELLPVTDWAAIAAGTGAGGDQDADRPDSVNAYLFLLASEQAVYVEADDGSRAYIVELGASKELHLVPTRAILPGSYMVTRVGGDGDYIPAIADSLLADQAGRLRREQERWTAGLQQLIASAGMPTVATRLAAAGSPRATSGNVRRWASGDSIRTENYEDFLAIMQVIGLGENAAALWRDMDLIDQAHRRAGQRVRVLLNREIRKADTRELERQGWQDYDVEEIEGEGALRVARVEARHPDVVRVSARQTRRLLPVERDLWQG